MLSCWATWHPRPGNRSGSYITEWRGTIGTKHLAIIWNKKDLHRYLNSLGVQVLTQAWQLFQLDTSRYSLCTASPEHPDSPTHSWVPTLSAPGHRKPEEGQHTLQDRCPKTWVSSTVILHIIQKTNKCKLPWPKCPSAFILGHWLGMFVHLHCQWKIKF